jgi:hypothetical protein
MIRAVFILLATILVAFALAACGSGSHHSAVSQPAGGLPEPGGPATPVIGAKGKPAGPAAPVIGAKGKPDLLDAPSARASLFVPANLHSALRGASAYLRGGGVRYLKVAAGYVELVGARGQVITVDAKGRTEVVRLPLATRGPAYGQSAIDVGLPERLIAMTTGAPARTAYVALTDNPATRALTWLVYPTRGAVHWQAPVGGERAQLVKPPTPSPARLSPPRGSRRQRARK